VDLDIIESCFQDVWWDHISRFTRALGQARLIRLAAFAVSGCLVQQNDLFDGDLTWSQLEDTSLCLLYSRVDRTTVSHEVHVSYAVLHSLHSISPSSAAEKHFADSLKDLDQLVNSKVFALPKWKLWELFGACFYAIRMNVLLALGRSTVTLGELLPGALMTEATQIISVKLVPARVLPSPEAFGPSTPRQISRDEQETIDWTASGCVVVTGDGGDIFFALEDAWSGKRIVVVDQRKRHLGAYQPDQARAYLDKMDVVLPDFLVASGARLVSGAVNAVAKSTRALEMPPDCFHLSRDESELFHGALVYHLASSPVVRMNLACKRELRTVLHGPKKHVDQVIEEICAKRKESDGGFASSEELSDRIESKRLKVVIDKQLAEFSA